jgi:hypothetical protein
LRHVTIKMAVGKGVGLWSLLLAWGAELELLPFKLVLQLKNYLE